MTKMLIDRQVVEHALHVAMVAEHPVKLIAALRFALAEPVQEPVAWIEHEWAGTGLRKLHFEKRDPTVRDAVVNPVWTPLYAAPPHRRPLSDADLAKIWDDALDQLDPRDQLRFIARAIERAHGIGGEE